MKRVLLPAVVAAISGILTVAGMASAQDDTEPTDTTVVEDDTTVVADDTSADADGCEDKDAADTTVTTEA